MTTQRTYNDRLPKIVSISLSILIPLIIIGTVIWLTCFKEGGEYSPVAEYCRNACRDCYRVHGGNYDCDIDQECFEDCIANPQDYIPEELLY